MKVLGSYLMLGLFAVLAAAGCRAEARAAPVAAKRAFYYWRTTFALSPVEEAALRRHHVERLYVRLFDVVPARDSGVATPVARCAFRQPPPAGIELVPVVFIANSVFEREGAGRAEAGAAGGPSAATDEAKAVALAARVWRLARDLAGGAGFSFREIQVDSDWTERTRDAFFAFCRALGSAVHGTGGQLGATIRLHQVKYPERTGVPPADRGMLMFYNMGRIEPGPERPSIFNVEDAGRYVDALDRYPLPLDAALPVFSWAIQGRGGRVVGLVEKIDAAILDADPSLQKVNDDDERRPKVYRATRSMFFRGGYLQKGDTLALEAVKPELARQAADLLGRHLHPRGAFSLALFDLDERNLDHHDASDLEAVYTAVRGRGAR